MKKVKGKYSDFVVKLIESIYNTNNIYKKGKIRMINRNNSFVIIQQLKNSQLLRLILLEGSSRILCIMPEKTFIKIVKIDNNNQYVGVVEESNLQQEQIDSALIINSDGFNKDCVPQMVINRRHCYTRADTIVFASEMWFLSIKKYDFKIKMVNDFDFEFPVSQFGLPASPDDFFVDHNLIGAPKRYNNVSQFLERHGSDYHRMFGKKLAFTALVEDNLDSISGQREFLDRIGFSEIEKDKGFYFKDKSFGVKYMWEALLHYLLLVYSNPKLVINGSACENKKQVYDILFSLDGTKLNEYLLENETKNQQ